MKKKYSVDNSNNCLGLLLPQKSVYYKKYIAKKTKKQNLELILSLA